MALILEMVLVDRAIKLLGNLHRMELIILYVILKVLFQWQEPWIQIVLEVNFFLCMKTHRI